MKVLIVGMPFSIHTVRWITHINKQNIEIHFFSSYEYAKPIKELEGVFFYDYFYNADTKQNKKLKYYTFNKKKNKFPQNEKLKKWAGKIYRFLKLQPTYQKTFNKLVKLIQPDIIHSMETQHAGYIVSNYYQNENKTKSPIWIHSTYGIDIDYFQVFDYHLKKIKLLFKNLDVFVYEGERDFLSAKTLGFKGVAYNFPSAGGGYKVEMFKKYNTLPPSMRKIILVKGYQDSVRRGLVALQALVRCKDILDKFDVYVYSCAKEVKDYVTYINSKKRVNFKIYKSTSYEKWIQILGKARLTITINLSDGLPIFDSMLAGAFHIQSNTSMADEWLKNGVTGFIVPPESPEIIENAIRIALTNDELVDNAATINQKLVESKLEFELVKERIINMYNNEIITSKKK